MTFYAASRLALENPGGMYSPLLQGEMQARVTGLAISASDQDFLPFAYPAATALVMSPLTAVDYRAAYWIMAGLNVAALLLFVALMTARLGLEATRAQTLALATYGCMGVYATLVQGQLSIFVAICVAMAVLNLQSQRMMRVGLWMGLLSLKPVVLPGFLLWAALRKQWTAFMTTLSVAGIVAGLSLAWVWPDGYLDYRSISGRMLDGSFYTAQGSQMSNLRGLAHYLNLGDSGWFILMGGLLIIVRIARVSREWDYVLLLLSLPLFSVHMNMQEMVLLLPAVAFAIRLMPMTTGTQRTIILGVFLATWPRALISVPIFPALLLSLVLWIALSGRYMQPYSLPHKGTVGLSG